MSDDEKKIPVKAKRIEKRAPTENDESEEPISNINEKVSSSKDNSKKERDRDQDHDRERDGGKDRERNDRRHRERERDREGERERERERERSPPKTRIRRRSLSRSRSPPIRRRDRSRSRSRSRDRGDRKKRDRSHSRSPEKEREKEKEKEKEKETENPPPRRSRFSDKPSSDSSSSSSSSTSSAADVIAAVAAASAASNIAQHMINPAYAALLGQLPSAPSSSSMVPPPQIHLPLPTSIIPNIPFIPLVPKESKELFVGNVVTTGVTDIVLKEFLNGAMRQIGVVTGGVDDPISGCRMNTKFCFIEFRNVEDCTAALNLNGIPFMGQCLKISRPSKYSGPHTPSKTWQEITGQVAPLEGGIDGGGGGGGDGGGGGGGVGIGNGGSGVGIPDPSTKNQREIFVGNTALDITEAALSEFIGGALQKMGMSSTPDGSIMQVRVNGRFCFVEFRTKEEAANALNLNGIPFMGTALKISRPSKFNNSTKYSFFTWDDLLARWMTGELKLMTSGVPTKVVRLTNMVNPSELEDDTMHEELIEDTADECSQFGKVVSVKAPRLVEGLRPHEGVGQVFVEFGTEEEAKTALCALKGRLFDGRIVDAKFYPHDAYISKNYAIDLQIFVVTQQGPVSIDAVLA